MKTKRLNIFFAFLTALTLVTIFAEIAPAQKKPQTKITARNSLTLKSVGDGEKVRLSLGGKSKIVRLEGTEIGEFIAGGAPPHRFATLLSVRRNKQFYIVAKFTSGAALSNPRGPCGGDRPQTLLLIKTDRNLKIETIATEIFASCIYNGAGRYVQGKMRIDKKSVSVSFDEGRKKYTLFFDADEAASNLQLISR